MNSERIEWLKWRKGGIGSSDMPIIMGVSPWSTPYKLWEEKISPEAREDDSNSFIRQKGNRIEPKVRALFELSQGKSYAPKLVQMEDFDYIRASLDGASEDGSEIIEIKLLGKEDWNAAKKGIIPEKYIPQIQHGLLASQRSICFFLGYLCDDETEEMSMDRLAIVIVRSDPDYQGGIIQAATKFWKSVTDKNPPHLMDKDYKILKGIAPIARKWRATKLKMEKLKIELEDLDYKIEAAAEAVGHPRLRGPGIKMIKISREGNVQYKNIPELKGIDLDSYRGASTTYWKKEIDYGQEKIK